MQARPADEQRVEQQCQLVVCSQPTVVGDSPELAHRHRELEHERVPGHLDVRSRSIGWGRKDLYTGPLTTPETVDAIAAEANLPSDLDGASENAGLDLFGDVLPLATVEGLGGLDADDPTVSVGQHDAAFLPRQGQVKPVALRGCGFAVVLPWSADVGVQKNPKLVRVEIGPAWTQEILRRDQRYSPFTDTGARCTVWTPLSDRSSVFATAASSAVGTRRRGEQ